MKTYVPKAASVCHDVLQKDMQHVVAFDNKTETRRFCTKIRTYITRHNLQKQIRQTVLPTVYDDEIVYIVIVDKKY